ncbi:MAG: divalent-cation tolerance protein CutA [Planctomycetota bacterium]
MDPIIITTTSDDKATLVRIADQLITRKLAACVQIGGPVESRYHWNGKIESSSEWQCVIKTAKDRYKEIEHAINELHHYDTPQIVGVDVAEISPTYKAWLIESLATNPEDD